MIIQTGMRTDIPAFYTPWFLNRLREGYVCTRNPYNPTMVTRYELTPEVVDLIAFCTKNPHPMLAHREELAPYGQYWFVTITPYGPEIEPGVPGTEAVMEDFRQLSGRLGKKCVAWRYDPVFISEVYTIERHIREFARIAEGLAGCTDTCVISFIDLYRKVRRNFPEAVTVNREDRLKLGKAFAGIAASRGMRVKACGEGRELEPYGVDCGGCMTQEVYERALGRRMIVPKRKSQRELCGCLMGSDIGAYDTCGHLCRYCYANADPQRVRENMRHHDPKSPLLVGHLTADDVVHPADQKSWLDPQISLFDGLIGREGEGIRKEI